MRQRVEITSEAGIVVLADSQAVLPAGLDQDALLRELEPMAHSGNAFFLVTDDPVAYRVDLVAAEPAPGPDPEYEGLGGVFRLDVPSGRAVLFGWDKSGQPGEAAGIALAPGTQRVSVLARRPFESARHAKDMSQLLGPEWEHMQKVNKLGLIGCFPMLLTVMVLLIGRWDWMRFLIPLVILSWLPYIVLKRGRRFKDAERRSLEHERARAHYVIALTATPDQGLSGGFLRV